MSDRSGRKTAMRRQSTGSMSSALTTQGCLIGLTYVLEGRPNIALPAFQVRPQIDLELQAMVDTNVPIKGKEFDLGVGEFITLVQELGLAGTEFLRATANLRTFFTYHSMRSLHFQFPSNRSQTLRVLLE
jgi:hypothetical protein